MATVFYITKPDDPLIHERSCGRAFISGREVWFDQHRGDTNIIDIINLTRDVVSNVLHSSFPSSIKIYTSYGYVRTLGIAASGQIRLRRVSAGRETTYVASGDVVIESIPESKTRVVSRSEFDLFLNSTCDDEAELTSEIECLKVQNAKLVSEIEGLKNLFQEIQVKNVLTESIFVKKFDELCDVVEDVIDQNTSLRIQTQTTTARRNPFDE